MRLTFQLSLGSLALGALAACAPSEPLHDVSWYMANAEATNSKITWCKISAERERIMDCQNAHEAKRRLLVGSQQKLSPLDWAAASAAH